MKQFFLTILIAGAVIGYKFHAKNSTNAELHDSIIKVFENIPQYETEKEYVTKIFDEAHAHAFEAAYKMGGRRTSTSFDKDRYLNLLLTEMTTHASTDKHNELVVSLTAVKAVFEKQAADEAQS